MLIPYPGSGVWDWVHKNGRMIGDWKTGSALRLDGSPVFETKNYTKEQRIELFKKANVKIHNYPALFHKERGFIENAFGTILNIIKYDGKNIFSHLFFFVKTP